MGETPLHRKNLGETLDELEDWFAGDPMVYVSGNMMMYYVEGDKRKHVSPDVFVTKGIAKNTPRKYYLVWQEGKSPDAIIEFTSNSTKGEDQVSKLKLYEKTLKVQEYFLFDPYYEYLTSPLMGYRLVKGIYRPIKPVAGRLPSEVFGLHLEAEGQKLRLYDPKQKRWLPTRIERIQQAEAEKEKAEAENAKLRAQLAALMQQRGNGSKS